MVFLDVPLICENLTSLVIEHDLTKCINFFKLTINLAGLLNRRTFGHHKLSWVFHGCMEICIQMCHSYILIMALIVSNDYRPFPC